MTLLDELEHIAERARGEDPVLAGVLFGVLGACYSPKHKARLAVMIREFAEETLTEIERDERREVAR